MDIKGTIPIFKKKRGKFAFFEGTISRIDRDDKRVNCSVEVKFGNKSVFTDEKLNELKEDLCYVLDVKKGFISVDAWEDKTTHDKRRKLVLVVTDATITKEIVCKKKEDKKSENGLPF